MTLTPAQLDAILLQTLDDQRLSRSERQALASVLEPLASDAAQLAVVRSRAFELARQQCLDPTSKAVIAWLEDVVKLLQPAAATTPPRSEVYFSPDDPCAQRIAQLFHRAERQADVCVFTITDDAISEAILAAHRRGVQLRILTDDTKSEDLGSDIARFERAGIAVRLDRSPYHMHHKFAVFDGSLLLTGSYNWTRGAAQFNEENFLLSSDPRLCQAYRERFERLWQAFA
jgi:cardiolipin hydrolase